MPWRFAKTVFVGTEIESDTEFDRPDMARCRTETDRDGPRWTDYLRKSVEIVKIRREIWLETALSPAWVGAASNVGPLYATPAFPPPSSDDVVSQSSTTKKVESAEGLS